MHTHRAFKILLLHVFNRADLNDSGVVEKNIDLAIACQNLGDGSLNLRTFKQIALDREDFAAAHNQLRFGALELIRVPRQKCHFPAFARDLSRQNKTEPTRASADQDHLPSKRKTTAPRARGQPRAENRHRDCSSTPHQQQFAFTLITGRQIVVAQKRRQPHATPGLKSQNFNTRTYGRRIVSFWRT